MASSRHFFSSSSFFLLLLSLFTFTFTSVIAAGPPQLSGTVTVNINGVDQSLPLFTLGKMNPNGRSVQVPYNTRGYFGRAGQTQFSAKAYYPMPLLGMTLKYTMDMSTVAVGCNAAVYTVTMPVQQSGESGDYYCDANQVGGYWCAEMDLIEANAISAAITPHKCDSPTGPCDKVGCSMNSRTSGNWFTVNGGQINPKQPFTQTFKFVGSGTQVTDIIATITQGSNTHTETYNRCGTQYLSAMGSDFANGMVLVLSYWCAQNGGMSWLDGDKSASCPGGGSFTISDISLSDGKPVDPCSPNPCQHGGTCNQGKCQCPTDWNVDANCTVANPCSPNPCQNGGTCNAGSCKCPAAWQGDAKCSTATPNPCSPNPCQNGGTCTVSNGAATCTCVSTWKGDRCTSAVATDPCSPNPCQNGGTCSSSTGAAKCTCPAAWKGDARCGTATPATDACANSPCKHGGTCRDGSCTCPAAWQGDDYCSTATPTTDACASSPCKHGGTCSNGKCTCPTAWRGDARCSTATPVDDQCSPNPCQHGGTCVEGTCTCPAAWQGDDLCSTASGETEVDACGNMCDVSTQQCNADTFVCETISASVVNGGGSSSNTLTILIIVAAVVIVAVIGFVVFTQCSSQQKSAYPNNTAPYPTSTGVAGVGYDEMQDTRPQIYQPRPPPARY